MKTYNIPKLSKPTTVVQFLLHNLKGYNKQKVENLLYKNQVLVNDVIAISSSFLNENDILKIENSERKIDEFDSDFEPEIMYENDDFIVVNKPHGMACHAGLGVYKNTLLQTLNKHYQNNKNIPKKISLVHRLDKETSGVMVLAKNTQTLKTLQQLFISGKVQKKYLALVHGNILKPEFEVIKNIGRDPKDPKIIRTFENDTSASSVTENYTSEEFTSASSVTEEKNGKYAHTIFKVLENRNNQTLLECFPITGRTHQIRLHLYSINNPIIGDKRYFLGEFKNPENSRMYLHAQELCFEWKEEKLKFESPINW